MAWISPYNIARARSSARRQCMLPTGISPAAAPASQQLASAVTQGGVLEAVGRSIEIQAILHGANRQ
jgi:hypothetical protein